MLIVIADPSYAGDRDDISPPVEHPTQLLLYFCFVCRISRSLCNLMFWFLEWYFRAGLVIKTKVAPKINSPRD
jgi:hypothetical protein